MIHFFSVYVYACDHVFSHGYPYIHSHALVDMLGWFLVDANIIIILFYFILVRIFLNVQESSFTI